MITISFTVVLRTYSRLRRKSFGRMETEESSTVIHNTLYVLSKTILFLLTISNILIIFFHIESYSGL